MIEIVFYDSACATLTMAQRFGEGEYVDTSIDVCINDSDFSKEEIEKFQRETSERERRKWENATPLGGNPEDVYDFSLSLSIGDISEDEPDSKRKQAMKQIYSVYSPKAEEVAESLFRRAKKNLEAVRGRIMTGESVRIWYGNSPDEFCGMYWLLSQIYKLHKINEIKNKISIIKIPEWEVLGNNNVIKKSSCRAVGPEEWHKYLCLEQIITPSFWKYCAESWTLLQQENAPLRAVLNGELVSVPETIYDDFIIREIRAENETFYEVKIIGTVLGNYDLGVTDSFFALRIEEMIRDGKLEIVTDNEKDAPTYHRILKKKIKF